MTILVIDDDLDLRFLLVQVLISHGFRVMEAGNGQEALMILENFKPSVILIDLEMPVMNGRDFLIHLDTNIYAGQKWDKIPTIIYSASIDRYPELIKISTAQFHKPFNVDALVKAILKVIA